MSDSSIRSVLVVGGTGTVGREVVKTALELGLSVRVLARDPRRAQDLPDGVEVVKGDATDAASLADAVTGIDAVVFTHGGSDPQRVDYGAVPTVLRAFGAARPRIALMTSINVTHDDNGAYQDLMDWKRRGERVVRAFGAPYLIVRPGWFGGTGSRVELRQGDESRSGSVNVKHIAQVLAHGLLEDSAVGRTVEVFSGAGDPVTDWDNLFAATDPDAPGSLDGSHDAATLPVDQEPESVRADLTSFAH